MLSIQEDFATNWRFEVISWLYVDFRGNEYMESNEYSGHFC